MLSIDLLAFLAFIAIVALVVWYDRRNVKFSGIVLMRRTQHGKKMLDRLVNRFPRYWNAHTMAGVVIAIPAMAIRGKCLGALRTYPNDVAIITKAMNNNKPDMFFSFI